MGGETVMGGDKGERVECQHEPRHHIWQKRQYSIVQSVLSAGPTMQKVTSLQRLTRRRRRVPSRCSLQRFLFPVGNLFHFVGNTVHGVSVHVLREDANFTFSRAGSL